MRLSRIRIEGFGALQGMDLRFGPSMNLVVGPNEAGKSTLQEAIVALADSAHPDRTAQRVLDRLRQERAERIGKVRGRGGPLHELESRLAEVERQLAAACQARGAVDELAQKRETVAALTDAELSI